MNKPVIASGVANVKHIAAFDTLAKNRLADIDLEAAFVDMYDTVDASLLDFLAEELDMLGFNGWILANTEQKKRDLLKSAIAIKKTTGTPAAIRKAAQALGIRGEIQILEGVQGFHDGEFRHNGQIQHGYGAWATIVVRFSAAENPWAADRTLELFTNIIETLKPVRSRLLRVQLY